MRAADEEVPVLIVGGALTGLSTAVFLGWHGVTSLIVERHPDTLIHPRSRGVNARTVELYRQVGLEPELRSEDSMSVDFGKLLMVRAETLAGPEMFSQPMDSHSPIEDGISPCEWAAIDQDRLEILLRRRCAELGARARFSTELVSFEQDGAGVTAVTRDATGDERTVRAAYLVAADGGRSSIRQALGIPARGPGIFATTISLLFEADLSEAVRGRPLGMCYLDRPSPTTIIFSHDGRRRWIFATEMPSGASLEDMTDERCVELVRAAVGLPDLEVAIVPQLPAGGARVLTFEIGAQVAERYREGRIFLVGDAAHLMPPTGGFGASTGIQDAHNLAWKLAAVLSGAAGPGLLESYEAERLPAGWFTVEQTLALMQSRTGRDGDTDGSAPCDYGTVVFGQRYGPGAPLSPAELSGEPGTRAPHVALRRGREPISALDLYGRSFLLLAGESGQAWVDAARRAAARCGYSLGAYRVGLDDADLIDVDGAFAKLYGVGEAGAVLVRPDGFVGWRTSEAADQFEATLMAALDGLLARTGATPARGETASRAAG